MRGFDGSKEIPRLQRDILGDSALRHSPEKGDRAIHFIVEGSEQCERVLSFACEYPKFLEGKKLGELGCIYKAK